MSWAPKEDPRQDPSKMDTASTFARYIDIDFFQTSLFGLSIAANKKTWLLKGLPEIRSYTPEDSKQACTDIYKVYQTIPNQQYGKICFYEILNPFGQLFELSYLESCKRFILRVDSLVVTFDTPHSYDPSFKSPKYRKIRRIGKIIWGYLINQLTDELQDPFIQTLSNYTLIGAIRKNVFTTPEKEVIFYAAVLHNP